MGLGIQVAVASKPKEFEVDQENSKFKSLQVQNLSNLFTRLPDAVKNNIPSQSNLPCSLEASLIQYATKCLKTISCGSQEYALKKAIINPEITVESHLEKEVVTFYSQLQNALGIQSGFTKESAQGWIHHFIQLASRASQVHSYYYWSCLLDPVNKSSVLSETSTVNKANCIDKSLEQFKKNAAIDLAQLLEKLPIKSLSPQEILAMIKSLAPNKMFRLTNWLHKIVRIELTQLPIGYDEKKIKSWFFGKAFLFRGMLEAGVTKQLKQSAFDDSKKQNEKVKQITAVPLSRA